MESNSDAFVKNPAIVSTKSIDEGFESDPDREHSTDSDANLFGSVVNVGSVLNKFDHNQNRWQSLDYASLSSGATGTLSASHLRRKKELVNINSNNNRTIVYAGVTNSKVSIPRAGGNRIGSTSSSSSSSISNNVLPLNDHRRIAGKSIDMPSNTTRLIKSSIDSTTLRSTRDKSVIDMSRAAVINGKLVCITMPSSSSISSATAMNTSHNGSRHYLPHASNKPKLTHYQQYKNSVANAMNTNSIHTFYPAEGNISFIPSQYGLKYKSSHLNAMSEQQAPINAVWSQSLARQPRRYVKFIHIFNANRTQCAFTLYLEISNMFPIDASKYIVAIFDKIIRCAAGKSKSKNLKFVPRAYCAHTYTHICKYNKTIQVFTHRIGQNVNEKIKIQPELTRIWFVSTIQCVLHSVAHADTYVNTYIAINTIYRSVHIDTRKHLHVSTLSRQQETTKKKLN